MTDPQTARPNTPAAGPNTPAAEQTADAAPAPSTPAGPETGTPQTDAGPHPPGTAAAPDRPAGSDRPEELRQAAIQQLRKKRDLQAHLIAYVTVNLFLNVIWLITGDGFYWPIFPLLGWGIGIAFHVWDVYSPEMPSEERIESEMRRLRRRRT